MYGLRLHNVSQGNTVVCPDHTKYYMILIDHIGASKQQNQYLTDSLADEPRT